jgi:hypothetical protein
MNSTGRALASTVAEQLRVLIVAGISVGALVAGLGSRLAMLALRLTSPDTVIGVQSDDDFTIGRFTLSGTYNLLLLGAVVGILGVVVYQCVSPWLIGPRWFRRFTIAAAAGAVVGSMLIHSDGIDFRLLTPKWFAIALFILLPALFAAAIGVSVDWVSSARSRSTRDRRRWIVPIVCVGLFPPTLILLAMCACVYLAWVAARDHIGLQRVIGTRAGGYLVRACWLAVATIGLVALIGDVRALS